MRWPVLFVLLLLPTAASWPDDADDHEMGTHVLTVSGEEHVVWRPASEGGFFPHADLLRFDVGETRDDVVIEAEFAATDHAAHDPAEYFGLTAVMDFRLRGHDMRGVLLWYTQDGFEDYSMFFVGVPDAEDRFLGITILSAAPAVVDGGQLTVQMPKAHFRTPDFAPLREGDVLEGITVRVEPLWYGAGRVPLTDTCWSVGAGIQGYGGCRWRFRDQVGDDGPEGDVTVELAPEGVGHLLLRSDAPFRLSNGLATTYLFDVALHNFDDQADDVSLSAVSVPKGWTVLHPARVRFDAAGEAAVPVAVTVPFVHKHGAVDSFQLQALSGRDDGVDVRMPLGVVFADPPQPAGHHDTLHLHTREDRWGYVWMNTWADDPDATGDRVESQYTYTGIDPPTSVRGWDVRLSPGLLMGLDFQVGEPAQATVTYESSLDRDVTFTATVFLENGDGRTALTDTATVERTVTGSERTEVEFSMPVLAAADRIPPFSGNLVLQLRAEYLDPNQVYVGGLTEDFVLLTQDSELTLPLLDYHEQVDLEGLALNVFTIEGGKTLKHVNPGRTAAFSFNVTNRLPQQDTLDWSISGDHAEWATVEPGSTVVPGEGRGSVVVRVRVPSDATVEDAAELLLRGVSRSDETRQVFVRLTALVDTGSDIPDEAEEASRLAADAEEQNRRLDRDSPLGQWVVLAAVAFAVALRRRGA